VEPCPIIQFATENIRDNGGDVFKTITSSALLKDFRKTVTETTRGCIVLERPDLLREIVRRCGARDSTARKAAMAELECMQPVNSQYDPENELPEEKWLYRFAKKYWLFGFGAYA
jgi:hypothetical protein